MASPHRIAPPKIGAHLGEATTLPVDYGDAVDVEYLRVDLTGAQVLCPELIGVRCDGASLDSTTLTRATLRDVEFSSCSMLGTALHECGLRRVTFSDSRMNSADFAGSRLADVVFTRSRLELANFGASVMSGVRFEDSRLRAVSFRGADLRGVIFEGCDLTGAIFDGARMDGARLVSCVLQDISGIESLRGARVPASDVISLAHSLAGVLGIVVESEGPRA